MLRHFGAEVAVETAGDAGGSSRLRGQPELRARDVTVPGDPSSAAFPMVAALLVPGSRLRIEGVGLNPLRTGLLATLREMGAAIAVENERVEGGEPVGDLAGRVTARCAASTCRPDRAPSMIDEYPVLAVAAACAAGTTRMRGLRELRVKESDRLAATAAMLAANGVGSRSRATTWSCTATGRRRPAAGLVATHMDHRIAMSALVLGLAARAAGARGRCRVHRHQLSGLRRADEGCWGRRSRDAPGGDRAW